MKNYIALLALAITISSCGSDNLSNSKAKDILKECLEKSPEQRTARITIGKATFRDRDYDKELLQKYKTLLDEGLIEMTMINEVKTGYRKRKEFEVKLTEKALEHMENVPENDGTAEAKTYKYVVDEVLEVHETPSTNTAVVKVNFKASEITPFAIFAKKEPSEFWLQKLKFTKTSNGWKYCDNF
ncbi:hypothetical protein [Algibacter sp. 2305UL17-15]|uniref:hypothetical protein n=1 Tax=Algibacter sp. 2305UL17-15 TaxID=3231268 RepID=UPI003458386D